MLWLLAERQALLPGSVHAAYTSDTLVGVARRWQDSFRQLARPSLDHDQGFRFQLSFGRLVWYRRKRRVRVTFV